MIRAAIAAACLSGLIPVGGSVLAADPPGPDIQRRQAIQLEESQRRQQSETDILSPGPAVVAPSEALADSGPCFTLREIEWQNAEAFPWLEAEAAKFAGTCLGAPGLKDLRDQLTLALLARGYVTSRVIYPRQNLASGKLIVQLVPGRVGKIDDTGRPIGIKWFPLATRAGDLLNQRDLDQTLENLRRLPSQADTRFELIPGETLGESDLKLIHAEGGRVRGGIALDNSGSKSTGKTQLSGNLAIDSPLGLYDSLALNYNTSADTRNPALGSRASGVQWTLPIGYASVFLGANRSSYKQTVAGFNAPIEYTGNSATYEGGFTLTPYRSGEYKGLSQIKLARKISRNYIDNAEIGVQTRDLVGVEISHTHKHYLGSWVLAATGTWRGSLPAYSRNVGVVVGAPDWDGHYRLGILNLTAGRSFKAQGQDWRYQAQIRWQHATTALPPSEYTSIGGRYSVRGFDGEQTLSAESGGTWRNELGLALPASQTIPGNHETYWALDAGRIAGEQSAGLKQKQLIGTAIGLRGAFGLYKWASASYDISLGWPLDKPDSLTTARPTVAAFISFDFNT